MANFRRRFTKDEFKDELIRHLGDVPPGLLQARGRLEAHAELKAGHYEAALKALDEAVSRMREIAATHGDAETQQKTEDAIRQVQTAAETYGEACLVQNSTWDGNGGP